MRIAYICADPGVPVFGLKGCSIHVQEMLRAFQGLGAQIDLFATRFDGEPLSGITVHALPPAPKGDTAAREKKCLAANADLRAALDATGPFDLVYERYSLWSYAGMEYSHGVLEVNAPLIEEQAQYFSLVDRPGAEQVAARVFDAAKIIAAVSREVAATVARPHVHVVPNGVNHHRYRPGLSPSRPSEKFTVGFLGNVRPWHGLPVLLDAMTRLRDARLLVVGDAQVDGAECTGRVPPDAVPGLLASMDVAVCPYPQLEHFYYSPLKLFEYMAAGLPVVASRLGQIAEVIEDDVTGLLVEPGNPKALAVAIERLQADPALRRRLGDAARARVLADHTWDAVARRILKLAEVNA